MKILMLSDVYFPRVNGVSTSIATFRRELQRQGHEVVLIAPRYPQGGHGESGSIRIDCIAVPGDPEDRIMSFRQAVSAGSRLDGIDLVHVHTPFVAHYAGLRLANRFGVPCVATYHTLFEGYGAHYIPYLPQRWVEAATRRLSRRQCNAVAGVIAPSQPLADALRRYGVTTRIEVVPTGLEHSELAGGDGAAFRERLGIAPDAPVLVYVGRMAYEKNIEFLLDVVSIVRHRLPSVVCLLAGEGPALQALRQDVRQRGLDANVRFAGYLRRDGELQSCYRAGDVFVFASRTETQGLVLLEAMALGVPVVGLAAMGTREILLPQQGCLVAEDSVADFAAKTIQVLENPILRQVLAADAQDYAQLWSIEAMTERLVRFYREVREAAACQQPVGAGVA